MKARPPTCRTGWTTLRNWSAGAWREGSTMTPIERAWRGTKNDWRLHALSVFSVAVAFVCLGSALLVVVNVSHVKERWTSTGRASVYLKKSADREQIATIARALRASDGV